MPRRGFLLCLGAALAAPLFAQLNMAPQQWPGAKVLVVSTLGVPPYQQAVKGLAEKLYQFGIRPSFVELSEQGNEILLAAALQNGPFKLIIAVGPEARWLLGKAGAKAPVLSTMIFLSDLDEEAAQGRTLPANLAASVYLDPNPEDAAVELKKALPAASRVGLIVASAPTAAPWVTALLKNKMQVQVAECPRPADLVKTFLALRGKVDMVLAIPIPKLFNPATIEPLLKASIEHHLPIVGYSESFVAAGAMAGLYAPYEELGTQTADMALKLISGAKALEDETPRHLVVKTNQKIQRLMGRSF
jgi:putative tryptophan/tyrosine transport system substrate-binding protein